MGELYIKDPSHFRYYFVIAAAPNRTNTLNEIMEVKASH